MRRRITWLDEFSAVTEPRQPLFSHPGHVAAGGELRQCRRSPNSLVSNSHCGRVCGYAGVGEPGGGELGVMTLEQFFTPPSGAKLSSVAAAPVTAVLEPAKQRIGRGVDRHAVSPVRLATQRKHLRHPLRGCSLSRGKRGGCEASLVVVRRALRSQFDASPPSLDDTRVVVRW